LGERAIGAGNQRRQMIARMRRPAVGGQLAIGPQPRPSALLIATTYRVVACRACTLEAIGDPAPSGNVKISFRSG
jgi:hypothetical protein